MKDNFFAVLSGLLAGLLTYSFIGWFFTRKTPASIRYIVVFFLSLILFVVVIILRTAG